MADFDNLEAIEDEDQLESLVKKRFMLLMNKIIILLL